MLYNLRPYSPSGLKTFMKCPAQFKAKYIDKTVTFTQSDAAARGERLHMLMENYINTGVQPDWPDEVSRAYALGFMKAISHARSQGWEFSAELALGMDGTFTDGDYNDCNYLRCRIDAIATRPDTDFALILDWKTGKKYEADRLQLQVNAVCAAAHTGLRRFVMAFCYLDSGDVVSQEVVVPEQIGDWKDAPGLEDAGKAFMAVERACVQGVRGFPKVRNRFCRWCPVETCMYAGSRQ